MPNSKWLWEARVWSTRFSSNLLPLPAAWSWAPPSFRLLYLQKESGKCSPFSFLQSLWLCNAAFYVKVCGKLKSWLKHMPLKLDIKAGWRTDSKAAHICGCCFSVYLFIRCPKNTWELPPYQSSYGCRIWTQSYDVVSLSVSSSNIASLPIVTIHLV